jgi:hypothetical protein
MTFNREKENRGQPLIYYAIFLLSSFVAGFRLKEMSLRDMYLALLPWKIGKVMAGQRPYFPNENGDCFVKVVIPGQTLRKLGEIGDSHLFIMPYHCCPK